MAESPTRCKNCGQPTAFNETARSERVELGWCSACIKQSQRTYKTSHEEVSRIDDNNPFPFGISTGYGPPTKHISNYIQAVYADVRILRLPISEAILRIEEEKSREELKLNMLRLKFETGMSARNRERWHQANISALESAIAQFGKLTPPA
jgi:hypothetical protein